MAAPSYSQTIDTLFLSGLRALQSKMLNYIKDSGNPLHVVLAELGNVLPHEQTENAQCDLVYAASEQVTRHMPDQVTTGNLGTTATDPMTAQRATFISGSFNVNFAQNIRTLRIPQYMRGRFMADFQQFLNEQELMVLNGQTASGGVTRNAPFNADADWTAGNPLSLPALFLSGTANPGGASEVTEKFMGITVNDVGTTRGQPYVLTTGSAAGAELLDDIDDLAMKTNWGAGERGTHLLTDDKVFKKIKDLHRDKGALPDPIRDDLAMPLERYMYGTLQVLWHRKLERLSGWSHQATPAATNPVLLLNGPALKLYTWNMGNAFEPMDGSGGLNWLQRIGGLQTHETATALFNRVSGTYTLAFEATRSSLGIADGYNVT